MIQSSPKYTISPDVGISHRTNDTEGDGTVFFADKKIAQESIFHANTSVTQNNIWCEYRATQPPSV